MTDDRGSHNAPEESSKPPIWLFVSGIAAAIIAIFVASNTQDTEVQFAWLDATLPLWLVISVSVALGFLIGWSFSVWRRRRKSRD